METIKIFAGIFLVLAVIFLVGWIAFPIEKTVTETKTVTVDRPVEVIKYVDRNITQVEVESTDVVADFKDEAWNYALDEKWSDIKYCDGLRYKANEISFNFDKNDYVSYSYNHDNKEIKFVVEAEYDNDEASERCETSYEVTYSVEDNEDPVLTILEL